MRFFGQWMPQLARHHHRGIRIVLGGTVTDILPCSRSRRRYHRYPDSSGVTRTFETCPSGSRLPSRKPKTAFQRSRHRVSESSRAASSRRPSTEAPQSADVPNSQILPPILRSVMFWSSRSSVGSGAEPSMLPPTRQAQIRATSLSIAYSLAASVSPVARASPSCKWAVRWRGSRAAS